MAANNPVYAEMTTYVQSRAAELRRKSFQELSTLPETETGKLHLLGNEVQLTVYRTARTDDELLVVVQGARPRFLGMFTETRVEGFLARSNGDQSDAPEKLLWDYM
jgi:hypothetical protein